MTEFRSNSPILTSNDPMGNPPQMGAVVPGTQSPLRISGSEVNSSISPPTVPGFDEDVLRLFKTYRIGAQNIEVMSEIDISKIVDVFESDPVKNICLKSNLSLIRKKTLPIPQVPGVSTPDSVSVESRKSVFGSVIFPEGSGKSRDTNKWPLVLGRRYQGVSDSVPVSSFCNLLISYGIKESANSVEFYRFVMSNLESDVVSQLVSHLITKGCIEDSTAAIRLSHLYEYLKTSFSITDNPVLIQSKLEKMKQDSRSVAEFSKDFNIHLSELKMAQGSHPLTESYMISAFKSCLHEKYRLFADENIIYLQILQPIAPEV
jgi:hypothetical protein